MSKPNGSNYVRCWAYERQAHGLFDLIAISPRDILCVQVKSRDWPSGVEREQLEAFQVPANCRKLIHRWRDGPWVPDVQEL